MVTRVKCLKCGVEIPEADVNVAEGMAYCRGCGSLSKLADMLADAEAGIGEVDTTIPPAGCAVRDVGVWTSVKCSARSAGGAGFLLFFSLFWNGIVSIFVCIAIAETIALIFGSVPSWFPAPSGSNGSMMGGSAGGLIFLWLFLTPFILVGVGTAIGALTMMFGRVEVRVRGGDGYAFTGIGTLGWKRRFNASDVTSVTIGRTAWKKNDEAQPVIVIETHSGGKVRFGTILTNERRAWMTATLRELLVT